MLRKVMETCRRNLILISVFNIVLCLTIGLSFGVYSLPILTAETGQDDAAITARQSTIERGGEFHRNLEGFDSLHWGKGTIMVGNNAVWLDGSLSPGPHYRLYFAPIFVETKEIFLAIKSQSVEVESVKAFTNFMLQLPMV